MRSNISGLVYAIWLFYRKLGNAESNAVDAFIMTYLFVIDNLFNIHLGVLNKM